MTAANPNSFDHFRRGETIKVLIAADATSADHFRRGEPLLAPIVEAVVVPDQPKPPSALQQRIALAWQPSYDGVVLRKSTFPWVADVPDDTVTIGTRGRTALSSIIQSWYEEVKEEQWPRQRLPQQDVDNPPAIEPPTAKRPNGLLRAVFAWHAEAELANWPRQRTIQTAFDNPAPSAYDPAPSRAGLMRIINSWYEDMALGDWPEQSYDRAAEFTVAAGVNTTTTSGWVG